VLTKVLADRPTELTLLCVLGSIAATLFVIRLDRPRILF